MPPERPERLIVFTRFPEPGKTKTRLIPVLGAQGAARLQRQMTEHIIATAASLNGQNGPSVEVRHEGGNAVLMRDWLGSHLTYRPQGGGSLGRRMQRAFEAAFEGDAAAVVIIGSDIPGMTGDILRQAFEALRQKDLVLGPAKDGGYYLIGIRRTLSAETYGRLFDGIDWGSDRVMSQSLQIANDLGLDLTCLESLADVDRPGDLSAWQQVQNLSVIIPALNEERSLPLVLAAMPDGWARRVVVADNGSTDDTADAARAGGAEVVAEPQRAVVLTAVEHDVLVGLVRDDPHAVPAAERVDALFLRRVQVGTDLCVQKACPCFQIVSGLAQVEPLHKCGRHPPDGRQGQDGQQQIGAE